MHTYVFAFLMSLLAGLSTGIGSLIAFVTRHTNKRFLAASLGFSAGVMLYVSMVEIFAQAQGLLTQSFGMAFGNWAAALALFGGIGVIALVNRCIPEGESPAEIQLPEEKNGLSAPSHDLLRTGFLTALAITIHNLPEGLATFVSALQEPSGAVPIIIAIAIHNIPEGIAVSAPIYQATGSKKKAFVYSFLSGLAEPVGALLGWLLLLPIMNDALFGILMAGVAGVMVYISIDELLPAAEKCGEHRLTVQGFIAGMAVMAFSLLLFL